MGQASLSRMEQGKVPPSPEVIQYLLCQHPDVDIRYLFCGVPAPAVADATEVASQVRPIIRALGAPIDDLPPEGIADDYLAVPLLDGKAAAGWGGVVWERVKSLVWVYRPALGRRRNLVALRVDGDSMVPAIPPGAIIIIDKDQWQPEGRRKHIWALRTREGDTIIKRVAAVDSQLIIMSDNPEYAPDIAWTSDLRQLVIGKVIWLWQSLER